MKKKILGLFLALCVIVPVSLSAEVLDFSIGATAQYQLDAGTATSGSQNQDDFFDIENYKFGGEARLKFLLVEASTMAIVGPNSDDDGYEVDTLMSAGVSFDLLNLIRVGVGLGPKYTIDFKDNGNIYDENGDVFDFGKVFMESNCTYKANVDFMLGGLTLSANYTVPSVGFNIQNIVDNTFDVDDLGVADFDSGMLGVSVLISLI